MSRKYLRIILLSSFLYVGCGKVSPVEIERAEEIEYTADSLMNKESDYLVVFGDIQEYTFNSSTITLYRHSVDWIRRQILAGVRIGSVLEVGDVTWNNLWTEWNRFRQVTEPLAELVPYFSCPGNHDYQWDTKYKIQDRSTSLINKYAHFPSTDSEIVLYYEDKSLENYIAKLNISYVNFYLISLEFGPRKEVVEWADKYVESHPEDRFILMTHEWLSDYGERVGEDSGAELQIRGSSFSSPEDLWQQLVKPNNNIICVLCGHNGFFAKINSKNDAGRTVPQILFNLQYQDNCGNGLVQIWEFPALTDSIKIGTYSTLESDWYMKESTSFSFSMNDYDPAMDGEAHWKY